ncbi:MAG: hypothetical protein ACRC46_02655 [Thermoguttaceae bacterium]
MDDCSGFAAIGLMCTLVLGTAMGANPAVGFIVLSAMYLSIFG